MLKNKKAFLLKEAIVLGFTAVLLIFGTLIAYKIYLGFTGEQDDGSISNFDRLNSKVQELSQNDNKMDYTEINYFIGAAAVVGYNKVWDSQQNLYILHLKLEKPGSCADKACLCFFKGDSALSSNPYKPCTKFDKTTYFLKDMDKSISGGESAAAGSFYSPQLPDVFTKEGYTYLLLSGSALKSKSQAIYIEKYTNPIGEVIFYLAPVNDATREKISKRKAYIDSLNSK